jgi:GNAT superfamily N-acetyltransferase
MQVRSLGLSTDLQLLGLRGRIADRGDYLVVTTPDDPGYFYGNLLVLPAPPQIGEVAFWMRRFADELREPEIQHVTLAWDGIAGDIGARAELEAAGFTIEVAHTMTADPDQLAPPSVHALRDGDSVLPGIEIRPLLQDEVLAAADLAFSIGDRHDDAYRRFLDRRTAFQSRLVGAGNARFWGAFDGDALVGSLGLVSLGDVARYQDVQTATTHRNRGIASALLRAAARRAGCETVVIQVLPDSAAGRLYSRLGFKVIETVASACRYPPGVGPLSE